MQFIYINHKFSRSWLSHRGQTVHETCESDWLQNSPAVSPLTPFWAHCFIGVQVQLSLENQYWEVSRGGGNLCRIAGTIKVKFTTHGNVTLRFRDFATWSESFFSPSNTSLIFFFNSCDSKFFFLVLSKRKLVLSLITDKFSRWIWPYFCTNRRHLEQKSDAR